jgi:HK97 gp10 family phage protein
VSLRLNNVRQVVEAAGPKQAALLALKIRNYAVGFTPVDTGRLRGSIGLKRLNETTWRVGTNVDYALYVEFGTRFQAPQPFMRPALARARSES